MPADIDEFWRESDTATTSPWVSGVSEVEVVRIGPDQWQHFRDLRLRALREAPYAFGSRYDDWARAPDEVAGPAHGRPLQRGHAV